MNKDYFPKNMKPGDDSIDIDYELLIDFKEGELEQFLIERGIDDIEGFIRLSYEIPLKKELNGHYLIGTNNCVLVLFYKKNKLVYKKTQMLDLHISVNACITRDNYEALFVQSEIPEEKSDNKTTH